MTHTTSPTPALDQSADQIADAFPARVTIDLAAIRDNTAELRSRAESAGVMAVVKADGYGHGLVPSARAALAGGATWLGVAQAAEGLALRAADIEAPILTWLYAGGADLRPVVEAGIDVGVSSATALTAVERAARSSGRTARIHIKVDTGLGRNGVWFGTDFEPLVAAAVRLQSEGLLEVVGIFQHFAYADAPGHPTVVLQQDRFAAAVAFAERAGCHLEVRHLANSAATLTDPGAAYDLVRPGLALYGLSPVPDVGDPASFGLRPAMRLDAQVALVKRVPAGTGVSYGHTYTTQRETTLIDVPIGYSDGVPRAGTNCGPVQVGGVRQVVAGRVCMDQFMVDVGDQEVAEGERVVLFGPGSDGEPTAQDWAAATGTISYEIITRIGPRIPKRYIGEL